MKNRHGEGIYGRGHILLEDEKPVIASEAWQSSFKVTKVWITSHSLVMTTSSWRGELATVAIYYYLIATQTEVRSLDPP